MSDPQTTLRFYDQRVPALPTGTLLLELGQRLGPDAKEAPAGIPAELPKATQRILVKGPRFSLPADEVHRVFPPPGATGLFHDHIPMVVFRRRALPWERPVAAGAISTSDTLPWEPGATLPWLALIVLTPDMLASQELAAIQPMAALLKAAFAPPDSLAGDAVRSTLISWLFNGKLLRADLAWLQGQDNLSVLSVAGVTGFLRAAKVLSDAQLGALGVAEQRRSLESWLSDSGQGAAAARPWDLDAPDLVAACVSARRATDSAFSFPSLRPPLAPTGAASMSVEEFTNPPAGVWAPKLSPDDDEDWRAERCEALELSVETFQGLMPTLREARLLCHVREVAGADKAGSLMAHDGRYATVVANRFAAPPALDRQQLNVAHLVSLEGLQDLLSGDSVKAPPGCTKVRLVSLHSWTFRCSQSPAEDFAQRMGQLYSAASRGASGMLLRVTPPQAATTPAGAQLAARLAQGYVPLESRTRSGAATPAWYRGPLAPVRVARVFAPSAPGQPENTAVPRSAGQAMIFDPATGLFDLSYATAFETGRMLALANRPFAAGLLHWRREVHALVDLLLERLHVLDPASVATKGVVGAKDALLAQGQLQLAQLIDRQLMGQRLRGLLGDEVFAQVAQQVGKAGGFTQQEAAAPAPPPSAGPGTRDQLQQLLNSPDVQALLHQLCGLSADGAPDPQATASVEPLVRWLAQLALLHGVPLDQLVPDARLLPPESIRFFLVDRSWIDALLDGATSLGLQSSRDSLLHALTRDRLHRAVDAVLGDVRSRLAGLPAPGDAEAPGEISGFLLRSRAVVDWRGLEVRATTAAGQSMRPLRYDHVADDILFALFPEMPATVTLSEPTEGVVFGVDEGRFTPRQTAGADKGKPVPGATPLAPRYRTGAPKGVLDVLALFQAAFPHPTTREGSATFALQLVRAPESVTFTFAGGAL